jgi:hypothetical protein
VEGTPLTTPATTAARTQSFITGKRYDPGRTGPRDPAQSRKDPVKPAQQAECEHGSRPRGHRQDVRVGSRPWATDKGQWWVTSMDPMQEHELGPTQPTRDRKHQPRATNASHATGTRQIRATARATNAVTQRAWVTMRAQSATRGKGLSHGKVAGELRSGVPPVREINPPKECRAPADRTVRAAETARTVSDQGFSAAEQDHERATAPR